MLALTLLAVLQGPTWNYQGTTPNFAAVVDGVVKWAPAGTIVLQDEIPNNTTVNLQIKTSDLGILMSQFAGQTALRTLFVKSHGEEPDRWFLTWSSNPVPKGKIRLYKQGGAYCLEASDATGTDIAREMNLLTGYDCSSGLALAGINLSATVKAFKTGARTLSPGDVSDETLETFTPRLAKELFKAIEGGAAAAPTPKPAIARAVWDLTFLPGAPPDPDAASKFDFSGVTGPNITATALATALNAAYAPKDPIKPGDLPPKPDVSVSAVANSLVLEGSRDAVDRVRRLLATQLDVPQSQVMLELDTYQVSADAKGQEDADRAIRRLTLAQEIARVYKKFYFQAVKDMLMKQNDSISKSLAARKDLGVDVAKLFQAIGIEPKTDRLLGLTDVLIFLAYTNSDELRQGYIAEVDSHFQAAYAGIDAKLIKPLLSSKLEAERNLGKELCEFNRQLSLGVPLLQPTQCQKTPSGLATPKEVIGNRSLVLQTFGKSDKPDEANGLGALENTATRDAIEQFLILWLVTADEKRFNDLKDTGSKGTALAPPVMAAQIKALGDVMPSDNPPPASAMLDRLLAGDRTSKLTRLTSKLDDLLEIGVSSLQTDSAILIDRPLDSWIEEKVTSHRKQSRFGVSFGGSTKLAVTSRVPGLVGAEADSFFPYQPVAPIGLDSLVPLLARTSAKAPVATPAVAAATPTPAVAADPTATMAAAGLTPLETIALKGIFDQASKLPYDRKLSSGIHFSVLPTMLPNGSTVRLQIKLSLSVAPDSSDNKAGARGPDVPGPVDLLKSTVVNTELLANAFDITSVSSLKLDVAAPSKRDWEVPVLSQILPLRSWFVGPTMDKTVRHEAIVLIKATIVPKAMDLASRSLDGGN